MAATTTPQNDAAPIASIESDYGSDLDEATIDGLFSHSASQQLIDGGASVEQPVILDDHGDTEPLARLARVRDNLSAALTGLNGVYETLSQHALQREKSVEVEYDESNRTLFSPSRTAEDTRRRESQPLEPEREADTRTPIQRFRTAPKKPFSVTDIISPAWCELQYWYSLTKYGRIRRTPAMKQGSSVHKVLEEQVHTEVPVEVKTKEDRFALRIWNIIQGLRTLRRTGMTREMEVWGLVEGEVVNGIIDQITTTCPDEEMEAEMLEGAELGQTAARKDKKPKSLETNQRSLNEFLTSSQNATVLEESNPYAFDTLLEQPKTLYIVDVKTRQSKSLPTASSQLRPTQYQLMLYHRLFSALAANEVPADRIFFRYDVDPTATFSDTFLARMSAFDLDPEPASSATDDVHEDPVTELLSHNTLTSLWSLMIAEFRSITSTPSPLLTAEYRAPSTGTLIGRRSFVFSAETLDAYVSDEMAWWRGERAVKGVDVEEAFKCRICEFAEGCGWRAEKVEEGVRKARLRAEAGGRRSVV